MARQANLRNTVLTELIAALKTIDGTGDYITDLSNAVEFWGNPVIPAKEKSGLKRVMVRDSNLVYDERRYDSHPQTLTVTIDFGYVGAANETTLEVHHFLCNAIDDVIYMLGKNADTLFHDTIEYFLADISDPDISDDPLPYGEITLMLEIKFINHLWLDDGNE
jgi:hypothetical protein